MTWHFLPCDVADDRDKTTRGELFILTTSVDSKIYFTAAGSLLVNKVNNVVSYEPYWPVKLANVSMRTTHDWIVFKAS